MNPYYDKTFLGFFITFFKRLFTGEMVKLAPDELQFFVLAGVAISCALVGTFLVLRKMTMLANSLSHTILLGIVVAFTLSSDKMELTPLIIAAIGMGLVTAFSTEFLTKTVKLQEDASIGVVFSSFFALGVVLVTALTRNAHIGIEAVMGNVDALHNKDLSLVYLILAANLVLFVLFFKEYQITTFDPGLSKIFGISTLFFNYLLMTQMSLTAIGAFRAVGVLMVLAFITAPPLAARWFTHNLKKMLLLASFFGVFASLFGVALSRHLFTVYGMALSTAGIVVCSLAAFFGFALFSRSRI